MSAAADKALEKSDFEILFRDSPEYFAVKNARMIQTENMVSFMVYDGGGRLREQVFFPYCNIYRVKATSSRRRRLRSSSNRSPRGADMNATQRYASEYDK